MRLISGFVDAYLRLNAAELEEYRRSTAELPIEEREAVMELTTSWKEEGRAEGLREGLHQGLHKGLAGAVLRVLRRQLGELPDPLAKRIAELSEDQLNALLDVAPGLTALGDLEDWLARRT